MDIPSLASQFCFSLDFEFLATNSDDADLITASCIEMHPLGIHCLFCIISRQDKCSEIYGSIEEVIVDRRDSLAFSTVCEIYGSHELQDKTGLKILHNVGGGVIS